MITTGDNMTIQCGSMDNFLDTIYGLIRRGLTFTADSEKQTITLTGGY